VVSSETLRPAPLVYGKVPAAVWATACEEGPRSRLPWHGVPQTSVPFLSGASLRATGALVPP